MGDVDRLPERQAQIKSDEISYFWDRMIDAIATHFLQKNLYKCDHPSYADQEKRLELPRP